jgi:poly(A) polymerase
MFDFAHSPLYRAALTIVQTLREAGHEAYFAGGCVRDLLLGTPPKDFDVATGATPDQVMSLFPRTQAVGAHFGVILVLTEAPAQAKDTNDANDIAIEVATFRHDGVYSDGRRPDSVRYSTDPREDVQRRDFTINGMLLDPIAYERTHKLKAAVIDHVEGRRDLAARVIRAIGDPGKRFDEDKLRMLRAVRFAARLDFAIDPTTTAAIREHAHTVKQVSSERIREELTRMLTQGNARRAFELLDEAGLLHFVLPEAVRLKGVAQPPQFHPEGDVWVHTLLLLEKLEPDASPTLAWGALLHDIGKPATYQPPDPAIPGDRIRFNGHVEVGVRMAEVILERLRFSREESDQIVALVKNHMRFGDILNMREATLKRFLRLPRFEEHLELHRMDCLSSHGDLRLYEYAKEHFETATPEKIRPPLLVTGRDLIAAGYRPGMQFKEMLEAAEDAQLENRVSSRSEAMKLLRERFGAPPQAFSTLTSA